MAEELEITARITLAEPPARVWQVALDWSRQHEWIWATRARGGAAAGAAVVARTGLGPVGFTDTMEITEWDPPRRCTVRHTGKVVRGTGIFEVVPAGKGAGNGQQNGAEFRWTERIPVPAPLAGLLGERLLTPVGRWFLQTSLRRLARLV
ncbi:MAG TPA: SRPBCC family protein [Streptosporangiaceae bacterium]